MGSVWLSFTSSPRSISLSLPLYRLFPALYIFPPISTVMAGLPCPVVFSSRTYSYIIVNALTINTAHITSTALHTLLRVAPTSYPVSPPISSVTRAWKGIKIESSCYPNCFLKHFPFAYPPRLNPSFNSIPLQLEDEGERICQQQQLQLQSSIGNKTIRKLKQLYQYYHPLSAIIRT